tara:strand:- start:262 stop:621 length:360 start_codon:yes stop_codon:yes gene_type:complete
LDKEDFMRKYIFIISLIGFISAQSEEHNQSKDLTFIILKSGDSIRVNKFDADISIQPIIKFDLEFSDLDSIKYEISEINKMIDNHGNTSISRNTFFMIDIFQKCFNVSFGLILFYLIIF